MHSPSAGPQVLEHAAGFGPAGIGEGEPVPVLVPGHPPGLGRLGHRRARLRPSLVPAPRLPAMDRGSPGRRRPYARKASSISAMDLGPALSTMRIAAGSWSWPYRLSEGRDPRMMTRVRLLACRTSVCTSAKPAAFRSSASWPAWSRVRPWAA